LASAAATLPSVFQYGFDGSLTMIVIRPPLVDLPDPPDALLLDEPPEPQPASEGGAHEEREQSCTGLHAYFLS
jgi:hypothetical protein